jgi:hypothetical protein
VQALDKKQVERGALRVERFIASAAELPKQRRMLGEQITFKFGRFWGIIYIE